MDVLSDVLRVTRLKGSLFINAEFREPWCVKAPSAADLAPILSPTSERIWICHLIAEGRCWAQIPGSDAVALDAGDVVVVPHGDAHILGSGIDHTPFAVRDAVNVKVPSLDKLHYGGHGAATLVVCGWFGYERHFTNPALTMLPRLFRTSIRQRPSGNWLENSIRYALGETASGRAGSDAVVDKLAEVLFVEALRGYVESLPDNQTGWLAGLRDPLVGRCIALLHEKPADAWTVASLAQAVYVSRTVLAERFAGLVGIPPMQYLTQWRMTLAAHLLSTGHLSLTRIGEEIGYDSEAAFSRAFKREYGTSPGVWRRRRQPDKQPAASGHQAS